MDEDTINSTKGFIRTLEDFEFVFMLNTYEQIFSETDVVFDIVQQRAMDVLYCRQIIEGLLAFAKEKRSEEAFQAMYTKAASLTSDPQNEPRRKRRCQSVTENCTCPSWTILCSRFLNVFQIWKVCAT